MDYRIAISSIDSAASELEVINPNFASPNIALIAEYLTQALEDQNPHLRESKAKLRRLTADLPDHLL